MDNQTCVKEIDERVAASKEALKWGINGQVNAVLHNQLVIMKILREFLCGDDEE